MSKQILDEEYIYKIQLEALQTLQEIMHTGDTQQQIEAAAAILTFVVEHNALIKSTFMGPIPSYVSAN